MTWHCHPLRVAAVCLVVRLAACSEGEAETQQAAKTVLRHSNLLSVGGACVPSSQRNPDPEAHDRSQLWYPLDFDFDKCHRVLCANGQLIQNTKYDAEKYESLDNQERWVDEYFAELSRPKFANYESHNKTLITVFHVTPTKNVKPILAEGFRIPSLDGSIDRRLKLGAAVYFGTNKDYCIQQVRQSVARETELSLLSVTVDLGRCGQVGKYDTTGKDRGIDMEFSNWITVRLDAGKVALINGKRYDTLTTDPDSPEQEFAVYAKQRIMKVDNLGTVEMKAETVEPVEPVKTVEVTTHIHVESVEPVKSLKATTNLEYVF